MGRKSVPLARSLAWALGGLLLLNWTLCATAEGLGTCWIGAFKENEVKEILGIPSPIRVVSLLAVGYPDDPSPVEKDRRALETIVKHERWS